MTVIEAYSRLVGDIYERAGLPEHWPDLLQGLTSFVGGRVGQLAVFSMEEYRRPIWAVSGFERSAYRTFILRHATEDPRLRYILANPGRVICGEAGIDPKRFQASALYREVVEPFDIGHSLVSCFARESKMLATFATMRGRTAGPFDGEEMDRFRLIVPHLQRAFEYYALLDEARSRADDIGGVLDIVDAGIFLADANLRVIHANRLGAEMARSADGMVVSRGRLTCRNGAASRRLAIAAAEAVAGARGHEQVRSANHIEVPCDGEEMPYRLSIHPLALRDGAVGGRVRAEIAVVVRRQRGALSDGATRLRTIFHLTAAEASLGAALACGVSLSSHARDRTVSISTVRTHLKALFAKTETNRQAELVARLRENLEVTLM